MLSDEMQLIALEVPEDSEPPPWPHRGQRFQIILEVEHIGLHWDDTPEYSVLWCPDEVSGLFDEHHLTELYLTPKEDLLIASGVYVLCVEFFFDRYTTMDSWIPEIDYGLYLISMVRFQ